MQRLQALDEAGGVLLDLQSCADPIHRCLQSLFANATTMVPKAMVGLMFFLQSKALISQLVCASTSSGCPLLSRR